MDSQNSSPNYEDNNSSEEGLSKKHRAARACDLCRRKKIKCDVNSDQPCTTCLQQNRACTFNDVAKKRGPQKGYIETLENRLQRMEGFLQNIVNNKSESGVFQDTIPPKRKGSDTDANFERTGKVIRYHGSSSGYHLVGNIFSNSENKIPKDSRDIYTGGTVEDQGEQAGVVCVPSINGKSSYRIRKLDVNDDDLMVVRDTTADEEALQAAVDNKESISELIPKSIVLGLIKAYFDSNPLLPILDQDEYMDAFEGRTKIPPTPLLTYAICTCACFLVKSDDPMFKDTLERDEIYRLLSDRAETLFRSEYLVPRIPTIQAFVLFASHPAYCNSAHKNWILAGMAVRMAQDLGLHRVMRAVEALEFNTKRKRLWYSVYITDRWCCAILGRPLAIADSDCDMDFSLTEKFGSSKDLTVFLYFFKLSGILGEVLRLLYSPKANFNGYNTNVTVQTVQMLRKMLDDWYSSVPEDYKVTENDLHNFPENSYLYVDTIKITQGGPLTVCYYAVIILLYRPFVITRQDNADISFTAESADICITAAKLSIKTAQIVPLKSLIVFGWNSAGCAVFSAVLVHAFNTKNSDARIAQDAKEFLRISIDEILEPMTKDTPVDNCMTTFLRTIPSLLDRNLTPTKDTAQNVQQPSLMNVQNILSGSQNSSKNFNSPEQPQPSSWFFITHETSIWQSLFSNSSALFSEGTIEKGFGSDGWNNSFTGN